MPQPILPDVTKFDDRMPLSIRPTIETLRASTQLKQVIDSFNEAYEKLRLKCVNYGMQVTVEQLFKFSRLAGRRVPLRLDRTLLTLDEVLRLSVCDVGLRCVDPGWDLRFKTGLLVEVRHRDTAVPMTDWGAVSVGVRLDSTSWPPLYEGYQNLIPVLEDLANKATLGIDPAESGAAVAELRRILLDELELVAVPLEVPTREMLQAAQPTELEESALLRPDPMLLSGFLEANADEVLALQRQGRLPSLLDKAKMRPSPDLPQTYLILLDLSGSTSFGKIYRQVSLCVAKTCLAIRERAPHADCRIVPYDHEVLEDLSAMRDFLHPREGGTDMAQALTKAIEILRKKPGLRCLIHVTDGAPNNLSQTLRAASRLPKHGIRYAQVVYAQDVRQYARDLQWQILGSMGADASQVDAESQKQGFTRIARVAKGHHITVWHPLRADEVMLSLADLALGQIAAAREEALKRLQQEQYEQAEQAEPAQADDNELEETNENQ